jgi:hypothetical protein
MGELVSYVCVRADHQWGAADSGQVHTLGGAQGLAWCPDASLDAHERHEWRACDAAPLGMVATLAASVAALESAVS